MFDVSGLDSDSNIKPNFFRSFPQALIPIMMQIYQKQMQANKQIFPLGLSTIKKIQSKNKKWIL